MKAFFPLLIACVFLPGAASVAEPKATPAPEERIQKTLEGIIIPKLEFPNGTLAEVVDFLRAQIRERSPQGHAIPIKLELREVWGPPDPKFYGGGYPPSSPLGGPLNPASLGLSISLSNISAYEALQYITGLTDTKCWVLPDGIHIVSLAEPEPMFTRDFRIPPDFFSKLEKEDRFRGTDHATKMKQDVRGYLAANGVVFPEGAAAILNDEGTRLTVHTTKKLSWQTASTGEKDQFTFIASILDQFARAEAQAREEERRARTVPGPDYLKVDSDPHPEETAKREAPLRRKLQRIILPKVELKNADPYAAAKTLRKLSKRYDSQSPEGQRGVNIRVEGEGPDGSSPASIPGIPGLLPESDEDHAAATAAEQPISYSATHVSLAKALEAIARLGRYKVEFWPLIGPPSGVGLAKLRPRVQPSPEGLVTHEYLVPPGMIDETQEVIRMYTPAEEEVVASENAKYSAVNHDENPMIGRPSSIYISRDRRLIVRDTEVVHRIVLDKVEKAWRAYYAREKAKKRKQR